MRTRYTLRATAALLVLMAFIPAKAIAQAPENERVAAAIHFASGEFGLSESKMTRIGQCESGLRENPPGYYKGTFQQDPKYWKGRVADFNRWARAAGHETMTGTATVAIDNARLSARMMRDRGYTKDWPQCGKR